MLGVLTARETDELTITEVSQLFKVSPRTLRFYEEKGLLHPRRVDRQRLYVPRDVIRLRLILAGKRFGFSLQEIDRMLNSYQATTHAEPRELSAVMDLETVQRQLMALERQKIDLEKAISELEEACKRSDEG